MASPTVAQITPTLGEVARHIVYRTTDRDGNVLRTFTPETSVSLADAQAHIVDAAEYVELKLGTVHTTWGGDLVLAAQRVVARFAALYIESSLPDGDEQDPQFLDQLGRIARERLAALLETARDDQLGSRPFTTITMVGENGRAGRSDDEDDIYMKYGA